MLTGDKIETAINIGFSCKLITSEMRQIIIDEKDKQRLIQALEKEINALKQEDKKKMKQIAFIISGDALVFGLEPNISK